MAGGGVAAPQAGQTATIGGFGPTQTAVNPQAQGGMGGGMNAPQQRVMSPLVQQQLMRQQMPQQMYNPYQMQPQQMGGLQAALMHMLGQYNQPMARPQIQQMQQMPQYQSQALQYRPNTYAAQQNLSRVAPSVQKQAQDKAAEEAAAAAATGIDDAGFRAWQRQQYLNSLNNSGGGG